MEESLSGTLAIDLGNTNTVVAFQDQKDINSVLVEIPNITSSPGVIPSAVWFEEPSKITKIGISALKMRDNSNSDLFFHSNFKRLIGNSIEKINQKNVLNPNECGEKFFQILWANIPHKYEIKRLVLTAPIDTYKGYREWLVNLCDKMMKDRGESIPSKLYHQLLLEFESEQPMQIFKAFSEEEPLAGICIGSHGSAATYLLGWNGEQGRNLKANQFLLWNAIMLLKEQGIRWLDLGGIDEEGTPGISEFKLGVNGARYVLVGEGWK